jgi:hypothetical protein
VDRRRRDDPDFEPVGKHGLFVAKRITGRPCPRVGEIIDVRIMRDVYPPRIMPTPVRISGEAGIVLALAMAGAAGAAMVLVAPGRPEIGWSLIAAAVGGFVSLFRRHSRQRR